MVKRGHEVDLEYSKKEIIEKMNGFGYSVVEKLKFTSFDNDKNVSNDQNDLKENVTNNKYIKKINNVKNEKIKKSLLELVEAFKKK